MCLSVHGVLWCCGAVSVCVVFSCVDPYVCLFFTCVPSPVTLNKTNTTTANVKKGVFIFACGWCGVWFVCVCVCVCVCVFVRECMSVFVRECMSV